jgi:DNA-binding transcriptional MerR regulator
MAYTVKQLAVMSGVTVRTLHFYDEMALLKPAYTKANGYRIYEEPQLLMLQQILFYREMGFELKRINEILSQRQFEKIAALKSHRRVLEKNVTRTRSLILLESEREFSAVETEWRSTQSGANSSPDKFPGNRENNREFARFWSSKAHFISLNSTLCWRNGVSVGNRNRELSGGIRELSSLIWTFTEKYSVEFARGFPGSQTACVGRSNSAGCAGSTSRR